MAGTVQFNGEVGNIESNINKVDSFDKSLSEDLAKQKYPSMQCLKDFLSKIYPVGSIYISTVSTSPSTLFGGTWVQIKDRFLLAAGSSYPASSTGGEAKHTLTVNEMPTHNHSFGAGVNETAQGTATDVFMYQGWQSSYSPAYVTSVGGGQAHNNMPPYLAVYVWKRTA